MEYKLQKTTDYDLFDCFPVNRDVDPERLEGSMIVHGFIPAYPLHCVRGVGGRLLVKGGHNRLAAARSVGVPVYYVVCNDKASIHELEFPSRGWSMNDFLTSYVRDGRKDYIEVAEFCEGSGIGVNNAVSMFSGHQAGSGNVAQRFKEGRFYIKDRKHAESVASVVRTMAACGVVSPGRSLFVQALSKILLTPEVKTSILRQKVKTHTHMVTAQPTLEETMLMFESIYNRQSRNKVPVKFLAEQAARSRSVAVAA